MNRHLTTIYSNPRALLAYKRVHAVLNGKQPDRIPFFDNYWSEFRERYLRERELPLDTNLYMHFDHDFVYLSPLIGPWPSQIGKLGRDARGHVLSRDDFGLVIANPPSGGTTMSQHVDCAIKRKSDLDRFPFEDPSAEERFAAIATELPKTCQRFCPILKIGGPFSRGWRLRGIQQFLLDIGEDELFVKEMVDRLTDHIVAVGLAAVDRLNFPPILLHIADDFASLNAPLFSPAVYERIFLPNLKKIVTAFHARGFKVSYESEGNIWPMLKLLDDAGVDGLVFMEKRAGMRIEKIREHFGYRFFIWGNICNVQVLPSGDQEAICQDVYRVLSNSTEGGYMGLSAHSIGSDISSDAYDYFWGLMNRFGHYPIDIDGLLGYIRSLHSSVVPKNIKEKIIL